MPSEPDNSELEARLRELAPMVEAMHATEGQLPPEKREQLLERIADNALERRLKELAPMVEAVQATEGQLPPEKTELLLKRIAEGAAKRRFQARDEALWKELASAIARVPVALRKEWAKLPELLDKLPDPQSWLRAHLQTFDESARARVWSGDYNISAGAISSSAGGEYAINEAWEKAVYQKSEITRDTIRDGSPHLTKFLELCCLLLSAADGAFTDKKQEWVDAQFGEGAGDKFIENAQDLNLWAAIQDQVTRLSQNEIQLVHSGLYIWAMNLLEADGLLEVDGLDSMWPRRLNLLIMILEERGLRLSRKTRAEREAEEEAERPRLEMEAHQLYKEAEKLVDSVKKKTGETALKNLRQAYDKLNLILTDFDQTSVAKKLKPKEGMSSGMFILQIVERIKDEERKQLVQLEVEGSLRSLTPKTGALRDSLTMLPELFKNTPDARLRWEKLLSHENLIAGDVLFTGKSLHSGEDLYIAELPMPRGLPVSTARQPGLPEERYQGQKIGEYWESMGLLSGHFFCDRQGGMLFAPDFPRSLAVQTPVPNISRVWVREVQGLCANASELLVAPWTTPMAKCKVGDTDILVGKCGIWFNGARGLKDAFIHMLGPDYGMSRPMPYRNSFIVERLTALSHGFSSLMEDMVQKMDEGIEPKERHKDLDYYISLPIEDRLNCSTCLSEFDVTNVLWVATHSSLEYDSFLGDGHFLRFVPSQFSIEGEVLDPKGSVCTQTACPECHYILPYESVSALTENPTTSPSQ